MLKAITAVDTAANTLTITGHGLSLGDVIRLYGVDAGTPPAPLVEDVPYWPIVVDADTIRLAASAVGANYGTAIDLTTIGSGTFVMTREAA